MAGSLRDTIRTQAWSGLIVCLPALAGWLLLYWGATNMDSPAAKLTVPMSDWSAENWLAVFIMWAVMMAAMMLPAAMQMVSVFGTLSDGGGQDHRLRRRPSRLVDGLRCGDGRNGQRRRTASCRR